MRQGRGVTWRHQHQYKSRVRMWFKCFELSAAPPFYKAQFPSLGIMYWQYAKHTRKTSNNRSTERYLLFAVLLPYRTATLL